MSILAGPFERRIVHTNARDDEEEDLLVFGYACKLYRDDTKALMEESGQLLIPWMGDHSLMVDRYFKHQLVYFIKGAGVIIKQFCLCSPKPTIKSHHTK